MNFLSSTAILSFSSRLRAGRDQAHHLARRTQDRRPGRVQHSHGVERRPRGAGVPAQERTDPQVTSLAALHPWSCNKTDKRLSITPKQLY